MQSTVIRLIYIYIFTEVNVMNSCPVKSPKCPIMPRKKTGYINLKIHCKFEIRTLFFVKPQLFGGSKAQFFRGKNIPRNSHTTEAPNHRTTKRVDLGPRCHPTAFPMDPRTTPSCTGNQPTTNAMGRVALDRPSILGFQVLCK